MNDGYTRTSNVLYDQWMPLMGEAELKVVMLIARCTEGWHRQTTRLSLSEFETLTGLSRQAVIDGLHQARARGVIDRASSGHSFDYWLVTDESPTVTTSSQPTRLVNEVDQSETVYQSTLLTSTSQRSRPVLVNEIDQFEHALKESKETKDKEKKETPPPLPPASPSLPRSGGGVGGGLRVVKTGTIVTIFKDDQQVHRAPLPAHPTLALPTEPWTPSSPDPPGHGTRSPTEQRDVTRFRKPSGWAEAEP